MKGVILFLIPGNSDDSLVSSLIRSLRVMGYFTRMISTMTNGDIRREDDLLREIEELSLNSRVLATVVLDFGNLSFSRRATRRIPRPLILLAGDLPQRFHGTHLLKRALLRTIRGGLRSTPGFGPIFHGIKNVAEHYDIVLTPDPRHIGEIEARKRTVWFPYWFDEYHSKVDKQPVSTHDLVSNMSRRHSRESVISAIEGAEKSFSFLHENQSTYAEVFPFYSKGTSVLNWSSFDELTIRYFEVLGLGRLLLTNVLSTSSGVDQLFKRGTHFLELDGLDLVEQIEMILSDQQLVRRTSDAGRALIHSRHLSMHRAVQLDELIRDLQ